MGSRQSRTPFEKPGVFEKAGLLTLQLSFWGLTGFEPNHPAQCEKAGGPGSVIDPLDRVNVVDEDRGTQRIVGAG